MAKFLISLEIFYSNNFGQTFPLDLTGLEGLEFLKMVTFGTF